MQKSVQQVAKEALQSLEKIRYNKLLNILDGALQVSYKHLRKELPELSSLELYRVMNALKNKHLVSAIKVDGRHLAYEKTADFALEKARNEINQFLNNYQDSPNVSSLEKVDNVLPHGSDVAECQNNPRFVIIEAPEKRNSLACKAPSTSSDSWCHAAYTILYHENKPMGPTELSNKIFAAHLIETSNKTPKSALYGAIARDMRTKGAKSLFIKVGDKIGLSKWATRYIETELSSVESENQKRYWQKFKFENIPDNTLLDLVKNEILEIRQFLVGELVDEPSQDKLCFWVWFCYTFNLFSEGAFVFRKINAMKTPPSLYQLIKSMGAICDRRRE